MSDEESTEPNPKAVPPTASWKQLMIPRKPGQVEPNSLSNMITMLAHSPKWKGVFAFDEFSKEIIVHNCPPWLDDSAFRVHQLDHIDIVLTSAGLEHDGLNSSVEKTNNAIKVAAGKNSIHPVRDYFDRIHKEWDGDKRLDTWLRDYLGAREQSMDYLGPVGAMWLTAGVKRVFEPGAKFDFMLVLEGPQNIGKSLALRKLATFGEDVENEYFTDALRFENITHPSSVAAMQGKLIIEFAELSGMNRKEIDDIKNWITIQVDELQKKYENAISRFPRQFILAGTTNDDAWLRDPTGNRRFAPVKLKDMIDIKQLCRDRKQLWAEAVDRYRNGGQIYIDHGSLLEQLAEVEQNARMIDDAWSEIVLKFITDQKTITMNQILHAIPVDPGRRDEQSMRRVGKILRANGWLKKVQWEGGRPRKIWVNPDPAFQTAETAKLKLDPATDFGKMED